MKKKFFCILNYLFRNFQFICQLHTNYSTTKINKKIYLFWTGYCVPNTQYGTYYCVCQGAFFGTNCEQTIQPTTITTAPTNQLCIPNPCLNGGVCFPQNYNTFSCICPSSYEGSTCQFLINTTPASTALAPNPCHPNPCLNGGNCLALPPAIGRQQYG